jgi:hypothetical protein
MSLTWINPGTRKNPWEYVNRFKSRNRRFGKLPVWHYGAGLFNSLQPRLLLDRQTCP